MVDRRSRGPRTVRTHLIDKHLASTHTKRTSRDVKQLPNHSSSIFEGVAAAGAPASCSRRPIGPRLSVGQCASGLATIGLRNQGWAITSKTIPFADFAALADVDAKILAEFVEKTEKKQGKNRMPIKDYRSILDRKDIDAVMIATPDHWHTKIAIEAMYAGKDVYCEKPLTLTIDEGKLIERPSRRPAACSRSAPCSGRSAASVSCKRSPWSSTDGLARSRRSPGIGGMSPSPQIPVAPVPKASIGISGSARRAKVDYRACLRFAKATAAVCRFTATATTPSATGTNILAASSPTGRPSRRHRLLGPRRLPRPAPAR